MSGQNLIFVTPFCVCVIGKEIPYGGNMGPGQGGSQVGDGDGRKEIFRGGHWARAREGPRTISPKRGKYYSDQKIRILPRSDDQYH